MADSISFEPKADLKMWSFEVIIFLNETTIFYLILFINLATYKKLHLCCVEVYNSFDSLSKKIKKKSLYYRIHSSAQSRLNKKITIK